MHHAAGHTVYFWSLLSCVVVAQILANVDWFKFRKCSCFVSKSLFWLEETEAKIIQTSQSALENIFLIYTHLRNFASSLKVLIISFQCEIDNKIPRAGGGGYLVYLSDGDVPFFRVSFSPIFSRTGYQKKANFLEQVVKTCQQRKFCYNGLLLSQIFVFLSTLFTELF